VCSPLKTIYETKVNTKEKKARPRGFNKKNPVRQKLNQEIPLRELKINYSFYIETIL